MCMCMCVCVCVCVVVCVCECVYGHTGGAIQKSLRDVIERRMLLEPLLADASCVRHWSGASIPSYHRDPRGAGAPSGPSA
jgi:hypothetical protein